MSGSRPSLALPSLDKISANRSISSSHQDGNQDGLKHELAVFQATLTDVERAKLQSLKGTSCDADSVITFTADLDRANPARKGRSIATRLFSLLQIVQQFNQVVDTYVSSHPEIAALVWGSVKLAFTIMIATRKPWQQQLLGAVVQSFHGEMKPYIDDVRLRAEHVQDEISLAKTQEDQKEHLSQAEERRQAAETRKGLAKWFSQSEKQVGRLRRANETANKERKWETLLTKLSSYDHASAFAIAREKRHLGTAEWVFDEAQFQEWYTCERSSMLHIMGKIGSGKTILTANVVDYLIKHRRPRQVVSFFFVCFDLPAILDGFDECSATERKAFLNALVKMSRACGGLTRVKTLISSRESIRQEVVRCDSACFTLTLGSDSISHDLTRYPKKSYERSVLVGKGCFYGYL
ncbi:hypothetical protein CH35J_006445 [Colletotrichum higginsianum]|uniref:Nephrocystin 3-like N-terminal domain-containing protein n=1 Tax=Colletotrichum higginsianum TaxID=80884 RepID=A0A4T0W234_9PEZI|nr:hypothetical protein CH35J_006445 [Colletotrichum higginsianum]